MRCAQAKRYTVDNDVRATRDVLAALVASGLTPPSCPGHDERLRLRLVQQRADPRGLPDGQGAHGGQRAGAGDLHPANPGSVYRMTKKLDQLLFACYAQATTRLRVADLRQGIVWGPRPRRPASTIG